MSKALRIESAEVIVTSPGRNFVTLKIRTDLGITGVGDATRNGRELAVNFDETLAARYPYKRAYLPVNRLEDETLFHW